MHISRFLGRWFYSRLIRIIVHYITRIKIQDKMTAREYSIMCIVPMYLPNSKSQLDSYFSYLHTWRNVLISYAMHILIASATLLICIYFKNFMCTCTQFSIMLCSQNGKKTFLKKRIERGKVTFIFTPLITLVFYELRNEYLWPTYITSYYIHIVVFIYTYM